MNAHRSARRAGEADAKSPWPSQARRRIAAALMCFEMRLPFKRARIARIVCAVRASATTSGFSTARLCATYGSPLRFREYCMTPLLVHCAGDGGVTHLGNQLVESSGAKNHQGPSDHIASIAKSVGHIPWNHDHRIRFGGESFIVRLYLVNPFEDEPSRKSPRSSAAYSRWSCRTPPHFSRSKFNTLRSTAFSFK